MGTTSPADDARYRHLVFQGVPAEDPARKKRPGAPPRPRRGAGKAAAATVTQALSEAQEQFLRGIFALAEIDITHYRLSPLSRRIPACLRALRCERMEDALALLNRRPEQLRLALNALVIGVTSFFRDPPVFAHLGEQVLPRLLEQPGPVRVWSMACSEGAELYSMAMQFSQHNALHRAYLYGIDCRAAAIERARRAEYESEELEELPAEMREMFFVRSGKKHTVSSTLKAAARWDVRDVFSAGDWGIWDLILCRNLAIYLDASASQTMWRRIAAALRPGGVLVVGRAEKPALAELHQVGPLIYEKR